MKTFYSWLMNQRERDDIIGDLAKDVARDSGAPRHSSSYKTWKAHMERHIFVSDEALDALQEAFAEYKERN